MLVYINEKSADFKIKVNPHIQDAHRIRVEHIQMVNAMYNITSDNDSITIDGSTTTLEHGYYTVDDLQNNISSLAYDENRGKFSITATTGISGNMLETLGFINGPYSSTQEAEEIPKLVPYYVSIHSSKLGDGFIVSGNDSLIAVMPINSVFGEFITYKPQQPLYLDVPKNNYVSQIDFQFRKPNGDIIDLNGSSIQILLDVSLLSEL